LIVGTLLSWRIVTPIREVGGDHYIGVGRNPGRWYQKLETMESAIEREIAIKNRKLAWKIKTIEALSPGRWDLYPEPI
ncbi:MAG: hypothetical protein ABW087_06815, partial [Candidatus Thiodiazotropha sp.]